MSSKKTPQKPVEQKPEGEPVNAAIETKAEAAGEAETVETKPETDGADATPEQKPEGDPAIAEGGDEQPLQAKLVDQLHVTAETEPTVTGSIAVKIDVEFGGDLAARLTKAVSAVMTTGNPDAVHALHKVELIIGDLKNALPSAIKVTDGEQLGADLIGLLAKL